MLNVTWLMYGCAVLFAGLGAYMLLLSRRQARLERRIGQLETLGGE